MSPVLVFSQMALILGKLFLERRKEEQKDLSGISKLPNSHHVGSQTQTLAVPMSLSVS